MTSWHCNNDEATGLTTFMNIKGQKSGNRPLVQPFSKFKLLFVIFVVNLSFFTSLLWKIRISFSRTTSNLQNDLKKCRLNIVRTVKDVTTCMSHQHIDTLRTVNGNSKIDIEFGLGFLSPFVVLLLCDIQNWNGYTHSHTHTK